MNIFPKFNDGRDWFFEKRFGLFIHWGIYAIPAWHEQIQSRKNIPRCEYEKLAKEFNPVKFDPEKWLDIAEDAGMEYICFTSKHHDGFCMWDSAHTDYNIVNTPYGKDALAMLAEACHKRNFPLCLYYSVVDWHHHNYPNQGRSHEIEPQSGDSPHMEKYVEYLKNQIRELCSNYGKIHGIWWDMNTPHHRDSSVHKIIRDLQPQAVINDRGFDTGIREYANGDFSTSERRLPDSKVYAVPTEACQSVYKQGWGYKSDADHYSTKHLIQSIDKSMAMGGNYLLNVGPNAQGEIPLRESDTISKIGCWFKKAKDALYAEPASNLTASEDVFLTKKGEDIYVHLNPELDCSMVKLEGMKEKPSKAILLNDGRELECVVDSDVQMWNNAKENLRVRNIPVDEFNSETMIVKLEF